MKDTLRERVEKILGVSHVDELPTQEVAELLSLIEEEKIDYDKLATMIAEKIMNTPIATLNSKEQK